MPLPGGTSIKQLDRPMKYKRIFPEETPANNIPYHGVNNVFRYRAIVPADASILMYEDANGVLYIAADNNIKKVKSPVVSIADGVAEVSCETIGASIFYTIDGNMPSAASILYAGPIILLKGTTYRFVAIKNGCVSSDEVSFSDPSTNFRFVSEMDGTTISMSFSGKIDPRLEYSLDGGVEYNVWSKVGGTFSPVSLNVGETMLIRGKNESFSDGNDSATFVITGAARAEGNILSLLFGESPEEKSVSNYAFQSFFSGCNCLTAAPLLPATELSSYCYKNMFYGCTNLTAAPLLPAVHTVIGCYDGMFQNCDKLSYVEVAALDWLHNCAENWLDGVASEGTIRLPADNLEIPTGVDGIPSTWNVEKY